MDNKNSQIKQVNYKFWKDSKMMGMILLIVVVTLQIFVYMKVPVLSTINAYTIGMIFGAANPFFYIYFSYVALTMIFKDSTRLPSWVKLTKISYWFVAISVIFIISASGHYQVKTSWVSFGTSNFSAMKIWFNEEFISEPAWYPASAWGGALGAFLFSFFSMIGTGIGALIVAIGLGVISFSVLITGTGIGLYKGMIKKKNLILAKKEINKDENTKLDVMKPIKEIKKDENAKLNAMKPIEEMKNEEMKKETENKDKLFPFDDPFK